VENEIVEVHMPPAFALLIDNADDNIATRKSPQIDH
jgi:hypothetical protein